MDMQAGGGVDPSAKTDSQELGLMILFKRAGLLLCLAGAGLVNAQVPPQPDRPKVELDGSIATDGGAELDDKQLRTLVGRADAGDADAAFRLSRHFEGKGVAGNSHMWLAYAAALGHPIAQYNVFFMLRDKQDCESSSEAYAWLKSAALKAVKGADSELEQAARMAARRCASKRQEERSHLPTREASAATQSSSP
ncbi:hypothetical protein [Stenotrophomonas maltophilia]|uniref:hypothetical protein n=1 Tax=Stenotrophomonas maltophilia TaxID=40324 RepID=UPI000C158B45|nr:hypothetical protein [Stenotrophomonas maltophilia]